MPARWVQGGGNLRAAPPLRIAYMHLCPCTQEKFLRSSLINVLDTRLITALSRGDGGDALMIHRSGGVFLARTAYSCFSHSQSARVTGQSVVSAARRSLFRAFEEIVHLLGALGDGRGGAPVEIAVSRAAVASCTRRIHTAFTRRLAFGRSQ
jgi:hypothetical protein